MKESETWKFTKNLKNVKFVQQKLRKIIFSHLLMEISHEDMEFIGLGRKEKYEKSGKKPYEMSWGKEIS